MTLINSPELFRPQIRAEVIFGPPMISGGTTIYYVKDTLTEWFYRIGTREYFLMQKMDGSNTLQQIEVAYAGAFQKRLSAQSWSQLFSLLGKRSLLVNGANPGQLAELIERGRMQRQEKEKSIFYRRFSLRAPQRFLTWLLSWLRFVFSPVFVVPALIAIGALEVFFALQVRVAMADLFGIGQSMNVPLVVMLCALLVAFFLAVHEIAHGLACTYFGGTVQEIGVALRYFLPCAYCKIDDVVLFQKRWHRVATAFAGIFVNLLMVLPFAVLWWISPEHSLTRELGAFVLVFMNAFVLLNCLPFADLDGYLMLSYALNMVDLRQHAIRTWQFRPLDPNISRRHKAVYVAYGFFSLVYLLAFLSGALYLLFQLVLRVI